MPIYAYTAKNKEGKRIQGKLTTDSLDAAKDELNSKCQAVYRLKEQPDDYESKALSLLAPVDVDELVGISQSVAAMSESGMSLKYIFDILYEDAENASLKRILAMVSDDLAAGKSLSKALERHSNDFPAYYIAMVSAGERSGNLPEMMRRLVKVLTSVELLKAKAKSALSYPIALLAFSFVMFLIFFAYGSPYLDDIYQSLQIAQPMATRLMLSLGITMSKNKLITLVLLVFCSYLCYSLSNNLKIKYFFEKVHLKLPVVGNVYRTFYVARFLRTLSILYKSGLGLSDSIKLSAATIDNQVLMESLHDISLRVDKGEKLSTSLRHSNDISKLVIGMIAASEECGKLELMLGQVADAYETKAENLLLNIRSKLEPASMLAIGLIVASLLGVLGWPMLSLVG